MPTELTKAAPSSQVTLIVRRDFLVTSSPDSETECVSRPQDQVAEGCPPLSIPEGPLSSQVTPLQKRHVSISLTPGLDRHWPIVGHTPGAVWQEHQLLWLPRDYRPRLSASLTLGQGQFSLGPGFLCCNIRQFVLQEYQDGPGPWTDQLLQRVVFFLSCFNYVSVCERVAQTCECIDSPRPEVQHCLQLES